MKEVVKIDSLAIGYGKGFTRKTLHDNLSASASAGELVALIGRNGAGKSTLLKTISGLIPRLEGSLFINGNDLRTYSRYRLARTLGYISTEKVNAANLKVSELVSLGRFPHTDWTGRLDRESISVINNSISKTGIEYLSGRYVSELSDGERQRAMIARVLAQDTEIMILDEPFAFLDLTSRYELLHLLMRLARRGKSVIFSTHDYEIALNHSDKLWILNKNGLSEGSPEDLLLKGIPDHLFDTAAGSFDPVNVTFRLHPSGSGAIFINGEGVLKQWVLKAFRRTGYMESGIMTDPYINILPGQVTSIQLIHKGMVEEHKSLYSLINSLNSMQLQETS